MSKMDLAPVALDDLDPAIAGPIRAASERLGYYGEMFQYLANGPAALAAFLSYSGALRPTLDPALSELIALTVCTRMDFAYERIQHERLAINLGLSRAWIAALVEQGPDEVLTAGERAARALAIGLVDGRYADARSAFPQVAAAYDAEQAVAALFQITRFIDVCRMGLLLEAELPVPSIFAEGSGT